MSWLDLVDQRGSAVHKEKEVAQAKAEKLAERLRSLGIDPEQV